MPKLTETLSELSKPSAKAAPVAKRPQFVTHEQTLRMLKLLHPSVNWDDPKIYNKFLDFMTASGKVSRSEE